VKKAILADGEISPAEAKWLEQFLLADGKVDDLEKEFLRELKASAYLGLAAPRFLLRMPYGKKTDPIDAFAFEEFTRQSGLSGMLWGHPALIPALLLAETYLRQGAKMQLGSTMNVGDMAYYVYTDPDGDQVALPCTERLYTEKQSVAVSNYGVMPLLSLRGRPELRLGGFTSVAGPAIAGFWGTVDTSTPPPPAAPERVAETESAEAPVDATAEAAVDTSELDALIAGLEAAPEPAAEAPPAAEATEDDLDALLASLNAEPPPAAPDATESDLDALLASLN
jgi:hypothetical protein